MQFLPYVRSIYIFLLKNLEKFTSVGVLMLFVVSLFLTLKKWDFKWYLCINSGGNMSYPVRPRNTRGLLKCVHCSYTSYLRQNFERHILTHSEVRLKYSCQICPRSYTREDNLKRHMKEHFTKK